MEAMLAAKSQCSSCMHQERPYSAGGATTVRPPLVLRVLRSRRWAQLGLCRAISSLAGGLLTECGQHGLPLGGEIIGAQFLPFPS